MAPELGVFALILAFCLSLSQAFFGLIGAWRAKLREEGNRCT